MKFKKYKLVDIGKIVTGNTPSKSNCLYYDSKDILFVKPDDLSVDRVSHITSSKEYISNNASLNARILPKGSVLVTCIGTIGKVAITDLEAVAINQQINAIIPNKQIVDEGYLAYLMWHLKKQLQFIANAPVVPIINKSQFSEFQVEIPDLIYQQRVLLILNKAQELIDKRRAQIEALDQLTQSVFLEMFGDPGNNPNEYQYEKLENHIDFLTSGSRGWAKYFAESGEMFITIKNVKQGEIIFDNVTYVNPPKTKEAERTKVQEGDLLISITADLGRTAVVSEEVASKGAYINQHLSLLRLNSNCNPTYISFFLESPAGRRQFQSLNQEGVKAGLNFTSIKSLEIMVPPLHLQNKFEEVYLKVKECKKSLQKSLTELENNFNSLMQRAFKGELFND
ncbi:restriction endonuclease subunit S [Brevibacillus sp. NRS-1366]|uniref:restriction endonuclease subunit S n=1 Tax=Brevibacillus sp. NRS-1366 TaxID=3233899 RepID=UPI003D1E2D0F